MNIDSIQSGVVSDHITAGKGRVIYKLLHLDDLDCSVAMIMNASSHKMGKKDIIKIDSNIPVDVDVIGYVDPEATINIIQNGTLVEKRALQLPELLTNVIRCKNPRCITSVEQELTQVFKLTDRNKKIYRCIYCEAKAGK